MGKIFIANASTAAATDGIIAVECPVVSGGKRRVYLHEITMAPRGANWAADVQLYLCDDYAPVNLVTNGTFATDSGWTKGTGWTIADGKASKATAATTALSQEITCIDNEVYTLTYGIVKTANGVTPSWGGFDFTADRATGTYTEVMLAASTEATLAFTADATADGDFDNVILYRVGSTVEGTYMMHDSIRSGTTAPYVRKFDTKQPWSQKGFSLYTTSGGASCIIDMTMVYEVV